MNKIKGPGEKSGGKIHVYEREGGGSRGKLDQKGRGCVLGTFP